MLHEPTISTLENQVPEIELDKSSEEENKEASESSTSAIPQKLSNQESFSEDLVSLVQSSYCMCEIDSFVGNFLGMQNPPLDGQSMYYGNYGVPPMMGAGQGLNFNELRGTVYENFVIYSKNDINLQLLKEFEYKTENRITPSGRTQTVYICGVED